MTSLRILSISIIGRANNPLYVSNFSARQGGDADLKWHYVAHTSLDIFEERESAGLKLTDGYLGLLFAMDDYAVYGFQTSTRIKFVLVLGLADIIVKDTDVKTIFRAIHNAYIKYICNPFNAVEPETPYAVAAPIRSPKFASAINAIAGYTPAEPQALIDITA